jgi:hypothetical protein
MSEQVVADELSVEDQLTRLKERKDKYLLFAEFENYKKELQKSV